MITCEHTAARAFMLCTQCEVWRCRKCYSHKHQMCRSCPGAQLPACDVATPKPAGVGEREQRAQRPLSSPSVGEDKENSQEDSR